MLVSASLVIDSHNHSAGHGAPIEITYFLSQSYSGSYSSGSWSGGHPYSGSFTGSGIFTPVTSTYTVPYFEGYGGTNVSTNSLGQIIISSSMGDTNASYLLVNPDGGKPNSRVFAVTGGLSVTDGGPGGSYLLSSSAPVFQNMVGQGGIVVSHAGQTWYVSSSVPVTDTFVGIGGTSVVVSGSVVTISSSISTALSQSFYGQGATSVLVSGSNVFVSSSVPVNTGPKLNVSTFFSAVTPNVTASTGLNLIDATGGNINVCLPDATLNSGQPLYVKQIDSSGNTVNVNTVNAATQLIDGEPTQSFNVQWTTLSIIASGSNWYIV
jgi:hypothetical protein